MATKKKETDITEDSLRLTGPGLDAGQAGIIRTLAALLNVSYESFELHQSYTMVSLLLFFLRSLRFFFFSLSLSLSLSICSSFSFMLCSTLYSMNCSFSFADVRDRKVKEDIGRARPCTSSLLFVCLRFFVDSFRSIPSCFRRFPEGELSVLGAVCPTPLSLGNFSKAWLRLKIYECRAK